MTKSEAEILRIRIQPDVPHIQLSIRQLASGEYVVVIKGYFYIWSWQDWLDNRLIRIHPPLPQQEPEPQEPESQREPVPGLQQKIKERREEKRRQQQQEEPQEELTLPELFF